MPVMPITLVMCTMRIIWKIGLQTRLFVALAMCCCGCTPLTEYVQNGFKVGPNYRKPIAAVASDWIDASDKRVRTESDDLSKWWTVFNDPVLNDLICDAYNQNLTLREAGYRVLQARAQLGIAIGEIFPQDAGDDRRLSPRSLQRRRPAADPEFL